MSTIAVTNASVVQSDRLLENAGIVVDGGLIKGIVEAGRAVSTDNSIDADGLVLFAGFIDIHIHGAVGVDVNAADTDGLVEVARFLALNGVTAWMPTLVPDSDDNYGRVIAAIDRLMEIQVDMPIAQAVGVHYEGIFANEKMCGALRPEYFKSGQWAVGGGQLPRLKTGVHLTTLAPEGDGGIELIRQLRGQGWVVSIGHTSAGVEVLDQAFDAGARHLTHFYNAMTGLHHRGIGVVGWALTNDGVTFDIIADGIHVHPKMLEFACRSKGTKHVALISDSVAPTGLGDGDYEIWGEKVSVVNGRTENERGSIAGSVITMRDAVNRMLSLGFSEMEVSQMASLNPARVLGIEKSYGSIEVGKRADIVAIDKDGNLKLVMIGGRIAFEA